jgi:hypothetical protein
MPDSSGANRTILLIRGTMVLAMHMFLLTVVFSRRPIILVCVAHLLLIEMDYTILDMSNIHVEYLTLMTVSLTIILREVTLDILKTRQLI